MAKAMGFQRGDRVIVHRSKHSPFNHQETYTAGEHGTVLETREGSSMARVRLDGFEGKHGNYHTVESVLPLLKRPVPHRLVDASLLHLRRQNEAKTGDYLVFQLADMSELLGQVKEVLQATGPGSEAVLDVQPFEVDSSESYGPLGRRPWIPHGERRRLPASAVRCVVHLEGGTYLRPCDVDALREKALLTSMDKVRLPGPTPKRLEWPPGAPKPRVQAITH